MKIGIGNDHAAVEMKMQIREYLESLGHEYEVGTEQRPNPFSRRNYLSIQECYRTYKSSNQLPIVP